MSKPWEQEWKDDGVGRIRATEAVQLEVKVAFWLVKGGDAEAARQADEVRQCALAAPDMARALLLALENDRTGHDAPREVIEAALRKAGVPL